MHVLLLRPVPGNDRFGLGPFFRIEPLGLEYIAAALEMRGHRATVADLRYSRSVDRLLRATRPAIVGIACMHALETDEVLLLADHVRRVSPDAFILVGGHSAAAFPSPFFSGNVDGICADDGELVVPALADAIDQRRSPSEVPGLLLRGLEGRFDKTAKPERAFALDDVPAPLRRDVDAWRRQYACLLFRPVWLIETARGCPFRCSFCSVWPLHDRGVRLRSIESVCDDFEATGPAVFVADDLFWYQPERSLELARALTRRGIRKRWLLVQSRTDLVASHPELLEAWRPIAQDFDIFFGLEAATDEGLTGLVKDTTVDRTIDAVGIARELRYGVTGNFVIDPDWAESDFERLWAFVDKHELGRAGFTILTPLPGTAFFDEVRPRLRAVRWSQYDMHHVLWEPRLGAKRFFELYCETWRRSILNLSGNKSWRDWARQVRARELPLLTRMLFRTQRMMRPEAYLREHVLAEPDARALAIGAGREPLPD
jgi:hopanoid C-3 methylase